MQKNKWSTKFDWIKSGSTYFQQNRLEQYTENRFISVGDIYFKLNKYLTGITFTYINNLNDIYKRDLLTGDGYSIVAMYNEYDTIDRVMKNIVFVDAAANININLNSQWFSIDNVKLKPGHLVLLKNQDSEFENDIYKVNNQYFLENAGLLNTRENSEKFSCSVKMGSNADKQFFLVNNGMEFPTSFEPKYFIEGKSFILKNLIKYNIYNTSLYSSVTSKIIFTDYDFARKQLLDNSDLYNNIILSVVSSSVPYSYYISIEHHHNTYTIYTGNTSSISYSGYTSSGITNNYRYDTFSTSGITIPSSYPSTLFFTGQTKLSYITGQEIVIFHDDLDYIISDIVSYDYNTGAFEVSASTGLGSGYFDIPWSVYLNGSTIIEDGLTLFNYSSGFDVSVGDLLNIKIFSGLTCVLTMDSFVKDVNYENNIFKLEDSIPNRILKDFNGTDFEVKNLSRASDWSDAINKLSSTPYSDFYQVSATTTGIFLDIKIATVENEYFRYFDYNGLRFYFSDGSTIKNFGTNNQYIKYKLLERLSQVNPTLFTPTYSGITDDSYILSSLTYQYTDKKRILINTSITGLTNVFTPYTYVKVTSGSASSGITLVYEVTNNEIVIEKPSNWDILVSPDVTSIQNIDGLENISNMLYEVYMNEEYDWYIKRTDNERKYIAKSYAELLTNLKSFRDNVTGILYENNNNEFILKLYDLENDKNLYFSPIELVFIGADRKTRYPVPLSLVHSDMIISSSGEQDLNWNFLNGGLDDILNNDIIFDAGYDVVLPGPNIQPLLYNLIDGGSDIV